MGNKPTDQDDVVIIKKYANRRLYNTQSSSYITLDHLAKMTREGIDFKVVDAKTGGDITHSILTQIIMEEEANGGEQILPVNFLRQLIAMYGNSMQSLLPHYLEASMDHFRENQLKLRKAFEESLGNNPLAAIAQRNMEMFKAAAAAFMPGIDGSAPQPAREAPAEDKPADDLAALKAQMAEMQRMLDKLAK
ncbi:polyhydroxyalkanoate synthesis repressor PhaR [Novosphingobium flavum]|uniref:polyhydroxyalkanoate synthesis repressor PhaR n=1 Tax=Novosphingobium aerophilum TaxID=2839843 RepID=UPI00163A0E9A|nr:polyhydroxyalkanoate synthesis repressor PhaR [Novosphingobium aerophilum]MBC2660448.1 polyhydroxyalkanoate synthesis repressor PhaR [Novosphingobium aerophilum]